MQKKTTSLLNREENDKTEINEKENQDTATFMQPASPFQTSSSSYNPKPSKRTTGIRRPLWVNGFRQTPSGSCFPCHCHVTLLCTQQGPQEISVNISEYIQKDELLDNVSEAEHAVSLD